MYVIALIFFLTSVNVFFQSAAEPNRNVNSQNYSSGDLKSYKFYLENNSINSETELKSIEKIENPFRKDFLKSVIYKKSGDYKKQFELLFPHLKSLPDNLSFYEELIFAANASNNFAKLEKFLKENRGSTNKYLIYLDALYNFNAGNSGTASKIFEKILPDLNSSEVYYNLSYAYRALGNYDKAFKTLEKGKTLLPKEDFDVSKFTIAQGSVLYLSGKFKETKQFYETGLKEAEAKTNNNEKIKALVNIGIIYDDNGDVYTAREYFEKAINLAEKISSIESSALANSEMGVSFSLTNELADAQKYYKISFDLYKKINDKTRLAFLSRNLGNLKMSFADYNSALNYFDEGLKFSGDNKRARIQNLTGIADVYHNLSNFTKAMEFYEQAKKVAEEIKDVELQANVKLGLGALYFNLDKPQKALAHFKEAEKLIAGTNNIFQQSTVYHKLGITYSELNNFSLAEKYFKTSIRLAKECGDIKNELTSSTDLAFLFFIQNNYDETFSIIQKIMPAVKEYELWDLLELQKIIIAKIYKQKGNINSAINIFKEADLLGKSSRNIDTQIESTFQLAEIFKEQSQNKDAEIFYLNAVKLIDESSASLSGNSEIQISYFANYKDIYDSLTDFYLSQRRNKEAFIVVEQSRSRNTEQNLTKIKLNSLLKDKTKLDKFYEIEWMLNSGIYEEAEIKSLTSAQEKVKQGIISQNKEAEKYLLNNKNISIEELQSNLRKAENLLSIYVSQNYSQCFLLSKNNFISGRINISRDGLLKLIYNISPYYNPEYDDSEIYFNQDLFSLNAQASFELYKVLFSEIISKIPRDESIIFNLPPELIAVPIELLVTEYKDFYSAYNYDSKNFLIYDYNISYTPSFKIYLSQRQQKQNDNNVLLIGDPSLENGSELYSMRRGLLDDRDLYTRLSTLYPLEFSREEINEIDAVTANTTLFLSGDATESNFKLNAVDKNIIHLSTHSFQYKNQPLIVFSNTNDKQNDGLLEAEEIVKLNLNSELVVLSSCRSGLGEIDKAEGILGMQKAFYEAGAKSLVISLWDVSDKYTAKFMAEFYKQLSEGKSKAEALRYAKINFIKNYSANPYYWSAFVLYGNTESINISEKSNIIFYVVIFILAGIILFVIYKKVININSVSNSQT